MITTFNFDAQSPEFCFDFRAGLEGEAAAAAAKNRTAVDIENLSQILTRLESMDPQNSPGQEEDFAFHLQVARSSHNDYYFSALLSLKRTVADGILLARTISALSPRDKSAAINRQHRLIFEAIVSGDDEAARQAMRAHLTRCKKSTHHWHTSSAEYAI